DNLKKEYIILDLDNTIYPVHSIGKELFESLFRQIEESGEFEGSLDLVKRDIMRKPYQVVALEYKFSDSLTANGIDLLKNLEYNGPITPFADYALVRKTPQQKFLVTTGFKKLQESKIRGMNIRKDFTEIRIVDPKTMSTTKKDVFIDLIEKYSMLKEKVLVVGDDPNSELKAANDIGVDAVLYDKLQLHLTTPYPRIEDYEELATYL
ncbi:MAG TPA: HAD family hydrolase, partial [Chitinophagaceae bacterium]|nr:HAD family hydrolase [Chitinophagaceae bacterium]